MRIGYNNIIFITGSPRSSTTFIGKVIKKNTISTLIYEPFNYVSGDPRLKQFLPPATLKNIDIAKEILKDICNKKNTTQRVDFVDEDNWSRKIVKRIIGSRTQFTSRLAKISKKQTLIIKDPTICRLVPHLNATTPHKIVYCKRPVAAIASSFLRLGWRDEHLHKEAISYWMRNLKASAPQNVNYKYVRHEVLIGAFSEYQSRVAYRNIRFNGNVFQFDHSRYISEGETYLKQFLLALDIEPKRIPKQINSKRSVVPSGHAHNQNRDFSKSNQYYQDLLSGSEIQFCKWIDQSA